MATPPGQPPVRTNPYFEHQRKRIQQELTAQDQTEQDAMKRRFASLGGLNSGAYEKQAQLQADNAIQRRLMALEGIDSQELADQQRQQELREGREFARSERLGGQEFSAGENAMQRRFAEQQAALQRQFQTGERVGGQEFAAGQQEKGFGFARGERLGGQEFARGEREAGQGFQAGENSLQRRFAEEQARLQRQFATGEREASQTFQSGEAKLSRDQQASQFTEQLKLQQAQFDLTTEESRRDAATTILNAGISAAHQANSENIAYYLDWAKDRLGELYAKAAAQGKQQPNPATVQPGNLDFGNLIANSKPRGGFGL